MVWKEVLKVRVFFFLGIVVLVKFLGEGGFLSVFSYIVGSERII